MKEKHYFLMVVFLAIINCFLLIRVINFDSKFDTLKEAVQKLAKNENPTNNQILISQFKEESYIRQQERDTTLILTVFALFAGFTAFFTFRSFTSKIEEHTALLNEKYEEHEAQYNEQHKRLKKLEKDLIHESATNLGHKAKETYETGDFKNYTMLELTSCEQFCKVKLSLDENDNFFYTRGVNKMIDIQLKKIKEELDKLDEPLVINNVPIELFKKRIANIEKVIDKEQYHILNQIKAKIKIEPEVFND